MENLPKAGERVEIASRLVPKCNNLLDVGCGDGVMLHFIKDKVKNTYGVDNVKTELKKAKKVGMFVDLINTDTDDFPYKKNFFDAVTCLDVIEHVKDPRILLRKIYSVLRKDGILIISTPNIRFSDHLGKLLFSGVFPKTSISEAEYDGGHIHFFTYKDMYLLLKDQKFKNIQYYEIINKERRGWKGRLVEKILGKTFMREFRTPGILITATK